MHRFKKILQADNVFISCVFAAFLLLNTSSLYATHLMGGSMTYQYLGPSGGMYQYKVTVKIYRYCTGNTASLDNSIPVGVYYNDPANTNANKVLYNTVNIAMTSSVFIQPPPPGPNCTFNPNVCVQEGTYTTTISVPPSTNGYFIVHERCCRNDNIANLTNPGGTGMSYSAIIPPTSIVNSSPLFAEAPVPFVCANDTTSILNLVNDPDGDMLVYSFVIPYQGQGGGVPNPYVFPIPLVTYNAGYNQNAPFGSSGYASISGSTGLTQYYSQNTGFFVVAVQISEYRNGLLIGRTRRDLQVIVITCPVNPPPVLSSSTSQTNFSLTAGDTLCFNVAYSDPNGDSISLYRNGDIFDSTITNPPATFATPSGLGSVSSQFCWVTTCSQAGVKQFYIKATDNGCPPKAINTVYLIQANTFKTGTITGPGTACANSPGVGYSINGSPGSTFDWTIAGGTQAGGGNTNAITVNWGSGGGGTVIVKETSKNGCVDSTTVNVTISGTISANAGADTILCDGDSVVLSASGGTSYSWSPAGTLSNSIIANPIAKPVSTTDYIVTVNNGDGCIATDTVQVTVRTVPAVNAGNDTSLCTDENVIIGGSPTGPPGSVFIWSPVTGLNDSTAANPIAQPSSTTAYIVQVIDSNSCKKSDTVNVIVNLLPTANAGIDVSICLYDTTILNASGGTNYTWSPAATLSNGSIANPGAFPSSTTDYIVTVTGNNACSKTDTVQVTVLALPLANAGSDAVICMGDTAQLNASGGVSYNWGPATGLSSTSVSNPKANPVITTDYIVTVTGANSCKQNDTVNILVHSLPVVNAGADTTYCIEKSTIIGGSPTGPSGALYNWSPSTGLSNAAIANPVANPITSTTYTVLVTDTNGCKNTDTVLISINPLPIANAGSDVSICLYDTTILNASGGTNYTWSPVATLSNGSIADPGAFPSSTTDYIVTVTDNNACSKTDTVQVTVLTLPVADAGTNAIICRLDSSQLSGSGGTSYSWNPVIGLSNPVISNPKASPDSSLNYVLVVTGANGCKNNDTVLITVNQLPSANAGPDLWVCPGSSVSLNATGGPALTGYQWSPSVYLSDSAVANPFATPPDTMTYVLQVTDVNNCKKSDTVKIDVGALVPASAGNERSICFSDSTIIGGAPTAPNGSSYSWTPFIGIVSDTVSNPSASPDSTTIYIVQVTKDTCSGSDTVKVIVNNLPFANAGIDDTLCINDTVQLNASGGKNYLWQPANSLNKDSISNPLAFPVATTIYSVLVTDSNGCKNQDTVMVMVHSLPFVNAGNDDTLCIFDTILLNASGPALAVYKWSPSGSISSDTIPNPIAFPAATTTYAVLVTDSNGCKNSDSVLIIANLLPLADAGSNVALCIYDTVLLVASGGALYQWTPADSLSNNNKDSTNAFPASTSSYTVLVTDSNGCRNTDSVLVTVNLLPSITASDDDTICFADTVQINASGGAYYKWVPPGKLSSDSISSPLAFPDSSKQYYVLGTDSNGCSNSDSVMILVNPLPEVNALGDTAICIGKGTQLNSIISSGVKNLKWVPATGLNSDTISNPVAAPNITTNYVLTGIDTNSCKKTDTVVVIIYPLPDANAGGDTSLCTGDTITLNAKGGTGYLWLVTSGMNDSIIPGPKVAPSLSVTYIVRVTDTNSCVAFDTVLVQVASPKPESEFVVDYLPTCKGLQATFTNKSHYADNYKWFFGDKDSSFEEHPIHYYSYSQRGTMQLISYHLICRDTLSLDYSIAALRGNIKMTIANIITPNGDGINDCFKPDVFGKFDECSSLAVFTRWGSQVYEITGRSICWDGRSQANGAVVPSGVYYYVFKIADDFSFNGSVEVLKD